METYRIAHLEELPAVACPCGTARRAFADPESSPASIHLVDVKADSEPHYHTHHTEIYYILEGEGYLELDGKREAVRPGTAVLIPPGIRHRPIGTLRILNIPIPAFDPEDEYTD